MFTGGGTVGHVTLNLLLIPKFIEDGWEVHYIGDKKRNRIPRDQKVWLRRTLPFNCNGEIASLFLFPKYDGCVQGSLGNAPVHCNPASCAPTKFSSQKGDLSLCRR